MAKPKVTINKAAGNLYRTSANLDALTAFVFDNTKPALFGTDTIKEVFSMRQAEAVGVTDAAYPVEHYQLTEIFRINPNARVTVAFGDVTDASVFNALRINQPRQIGYFTKESLTASMVGAAQERAHELELAEAPASIIMGANTMGIATSALPDLSAMTNNKVTVVIGQGATGSKAASLATSSGASVPAVGTFLGRLTLCNVAESVGFVQAGDVSGSELQEVGLGNGVAYASLTNAESDALDDKNYAFLMKYSNLAGTYFNGSPTASSDDYNTVELNRVIDKAIRATRRALTPKLNGTISLKEDGAIETIYIKQYEDLVNLELGTMLANNEISKFDCTINPAQDILADNTLEVDITIIPRGTTKFIKVNIGFATKIA